MSFTLFYKGHTIHVGPERASREIRSSKAEASASASELRVSPFKRSFKNKLEKRKNFSRVNTSNSKVHNIPQQIEAHRFR